MDNQFFTVDVFGSWAEVGMVMAAIVAGFLMIYPMIKSRRKNLCKSWSKQAPTSKSFLSMHSRIHEYLTELRVVLDGCRTLVCHFHNGGEFLDGTSMKKFSLTHESTNPGVSDVRLDSQDVLLTLYVELLEHVVRNDPKPVMVNDLPDCHWKRVLESQQVVLFSLIPLHDVSGAVITGFLCTEWCSLSKADEVTDDVVEFEVREKSRLIQVELAKQK
jgi:hypothetical protein